MTYFIQNKDGFNAELLNSGFVANDFSDSHDITEHESGADIDDEDDVSLSLWVGNLKSQTLSSIEIWEDTLTLIVSSSRAKIPRM